MLNKQANWGQDPGFVAVPQPNALKIADQVERLVSGIQSARVAGAIDQLSSSLANHLGAGSPLLKQLGQLLPPAPAPTPAPPPPPLPGPGPQPQVGPPGGAAVQVLQALIGARNALLDQHGPQPQEVLRQLEGARKTQSAVRAQVWLAAQHPDLARAFDALLGDDDLPAAGPGFEDWRSRRLQDFVSFELALLNQVRDAAYDHHPPEPSKPAPAVKANKAA